MAGDNLVDLVLFLSSLEKEEHTKQQFKKALGHAIGIISSYEYDCKHLKEYLKHNNPSGFCQGSIYKNAIHDINLFLNINNLNKK